MDNFRELLESDHVTVFDGAMGTQLYAKGVYINRSYDELNLTSPDLVRTVHEEYVRAGAEVIETNTFTATAHKLSQYGLDSRLREINVTAARLARDRKSTRLNSSHANISYAVFCLKKKNKNKKVECQ